MSIYQLDTQQLEELRQQMLHFARLQLQQIDLAEDMVQEAFTSACQYAHTFQNQSAFKTWVFAILKHKIIDHFRAIKKCSSKEYQEIEYIENTLFHHNGNWDKDVFQVNEWKSTEQSVYQQQFWDILTICLENLPALQARVFIMREHLDMPSDEICQICQISSANLHTCLYRARLQLQVCLSEKWFNKE
ncbi:sigma-70 family RNA polymerase sigma factor [Moraxella sp. ZY210820]|uniref:sigma-70 family RNA polymerase sigma factor n=1 Tax=unclassified Moraxella TaxID=2685852 RepID=UPI0027307EA2|nr:sigma-70 family RNA polymerase sigma factor [Moraxella sp. ZY210820]WLF83718.1 sigma-70 family RNA polymerase sigma factor [Moraxella sp. ZY210820]